MTNLGGILELFIVASARRALAKFVSDEGPYWPVQTVTALCSVADWNELWTEQGVLS